jgi:hypothetical protein
VQISTLLLGFYVYIRIAISERTPRPSRVLGFFGDRELFDKFSRLRTCLSQVEILGPLPRVQNGLKPKLNNSGFKILWIAAPESIQ